ncbi:MAG: GldG family protein [Sulfuricella sp.]|nr:GldG family protein [Sulfuricella sp.]
MKMDSKSQFRLRLHGVIFVILFLLAVGLLAVLAREYPAQWDITRNSRNSLSQASIDTLKQLPGPVTVSAYATQQDPQLGDVRKIIREFIALYSRAKPDLTLKFIDPSEQPQKTRAAGIQANGEMVVEYQGRSEHLTNLNEQALSSLLTRLARANKRLVFYLDGHGERKLNGMANHDLGDFGRKLESKGFRIASLNLSLAQDVPDNASLLLIASPQVDLMPGEVEKLKKYLAKGGNLLWLIDQEPLHGLRPLAEMLGLVLTPGTVVDPAAQQLNAAPTIALGAVYSRHPATQGFNLVTAFPFARQIGASEGKGWQATPLIEVAPQGWVKTGKLDGPLTYDKHHDTPGPVAIAVALERSVEDKNQRIVVIGNGGFLSNTYLGNGGNLDLGLNLFNWLAGDDSLITVPVKATLDTSLNLSKNAAAVIALGFLIGLPLVFIALGIGIRWRRRKA